MTRMGVSVRLLILIHGIVVGMTMMCARASDDDAGAAGSESPPAAQQSAADDSQAPASGKPVDPDQPQANDPGGDASDDDAQPSKQAGTPPPSKPAEPPFVLKDEVRDALLPLFTRIAKADVSRVNVSVFAETALSGAIVNSEELTYHIASMRPDHFTVYLKQPKQRMRIYNDAETMSVALAPDAYVTFPKPSTMQGAVMSLPVPLGPYPEPILALAFAGVDPALSMLSGMRSVEIIDRDKFRGETPSIHLRGVQQDSVMWDLWVSEGTKPQPLRLIIDLTAMLRTSGQVVIPENYSYRLRVDFLQWRMEGDIDKALFSYQPPDTAIEYKSLEQYYESLAGVVEEHPLLGKRVPEFTAKSIIGKELSSDQLAGNVVILDFWATWCAPCVASMPVISEVAGKFADKNVVFLAVNSGEEPEEINEFVKEKGWKLNILLDPEGELADAFSAEAIPLTVIVGKTGFVESVHVGFNGEDALRQRLTDELEVLSVGGRIASIGAKTERQPAKSEQAAPAGKKGSK